MAILSTPRTWLLPLTRRMIQQRLDHPSFDLDCGFGGSGPGSSMSVHFPPAWPGDPLAFFPAILARLRPGQEDVHPDTSFTLVARDARAGNHLTAIGQLGSTGTVSASGELEIGYGLNPAVWNQGYATEAVGALVAHLHTLPRVRRVVAATARHNRASERVLEKTGFTRTGQRWSADDGDLTTWAHERR
ncbi:GNAT family N-acetyltransferase [uncultured Deinococcus sp.]|uniref:GNAT family N-acetyltransferase n=1 Tax=uncultured Deinococcus sp. TaxID=158789 RepID=UPI0025F8897F|nr:GNAT family N-acetyltransferase [uncultured Deinococcus sp.]